MNSLPEFKMDIPLSHPWAQSIKSYFEGPQHSNTWPWGTMTFGGIESMVRLVGIGDTHYNIGQGTNYMETTWKAYPAQQFCEIRTLRGLTSVHEYCMTHDRIADDTCKRPE